ncbi:MAG: hypothetical protein ACO1RA_02375 [Planctomycetaceae bacterium]
MAKYLSNVRDEIIRLATVAGCSPARIEEIKDGCDLQRVRCILSNELSDAGSMPGTLVLSSTDAAGKAIELAYSVDADPVRTYDVFRQECRAGGEMEWIGEIKSDSKASALHNARLTYECDDVHRIVVELAPAEIV